MSEIVGELKASAGRISPDTSGPSLDAGKDKGDYQGTGPVPEGLTTSTKETEKVSFLFDAEDWGK